jgi:hypothetical protein
MAVQAFEVLIDAERAFKRADALAAAMEPHLNKLYKNGAIYSYTNQRVVPPGDVLLAAAVAAGISLDEKLGIGREPSEAERQMAELRVQVERLHGQVAALQERLNGGGDGVGDAGTATSRRNAERRAWARGSSPAQPAEQPPTTRRSPGRQGGR